MTGSALLGVSFECFRSSDFSRPPIFATDFVGGVGIVAAVHTSVTGQSSVLIRVTPWTRFGDENLSRPDLGDSTFWVLACTFIGLNGNGRFGAESALSLTLFTDTGFSGLTEFAVPGNRLSTDFVFGFDADFDAGVPVQVWMLITGFLTFCFDSSDNLAMFRSSLKRRVACEQTLFSHVVVGLV